jgi:hypothetical protein
MMFPQTPFAGSHAHPHGHPHFSPYASGHYSSNPFAPDNPHPLSGQSSGHYGYFHPFFNSIQPFSPSMLNQHGSGSLSRQGSFSHFPPKPHGAQSSRSRKSSSHMTGSSTMAGVEHVFSRLSEASPATGGGDVAAQESISEQIDGYGNMQNRGGYASGGDAGRGASTGLAQMQQQQQVHYQQQQYQQEVGGGWTPDETSATGASIGDDLVSANLFCSKVDSMFCLVMSSGGLSYILIKTSSLLFLRMVLVWLSLGWACQHRITHRYKCSTCFHISIQFSCWASSNSRYQECPCSLLPLLLGRDMLLFSSSSSSSK